MKTENINIIDIIKEDSMKMLSKLDNNFIKSDNFAINLVGDLNSPFLKFLKNKSLQYGFTVLSDDNYDVTSKIPTIIDRETAPYRPTILSPKTDIDQLQNKGISSVYKCPAVTRSIYTYIMQHYSVKNLKLSGYHIVIIGRGHAISNLYDFLIRENATVTICHSHTNNLNAICEIADIIINASPIDISQYSNKKIIDVTNNNPKEIGVCTIEILINRAISYYFMNKPVNCIEEKITQIWKGEK